MNIPLKCCRCEKEANQFLRVGGKLKPYCLLHFERIKSRRLKKEIRTNEQPS